MWMGVLTDGGLWHGLEGELIKHFNVRDGLGIRMLQPAGLEVAFLSGGGGGATEACARQLGLLRCLVGAKDKLVALASLRQRLGVAAEHKVCVGDDVNDLALQDGVGLLVATVGAVAPFRRRADAVLLHNSGHGAVRELADQLLQACGLWAQICRDGLRDRDD